MLNKDPTQNKVYRLELKEIGPDEEANPRIQLQQQEDDGLTKRYSSSHHNTFHVMASDNPDRERVTIETHSHLLPRSDKSDFKLDQTYLLCVDPQDKLPFQINMGTRVTVEDRQLDEATIAIRSKIERHSYIMRELLDEVGEKETERISPWAIKDSAQSDQFRRTMVQSYHLEQESQHFQRYIDKSDLSENLGQNYKQDIKVFIIEGLELFDRRVQRSIDESGMDGGRSAKIFKMRTNTVLHRDIDVNGYFILSRISLLQTADQVIDMISTKLEKEMHLLIDSAKHAFILKFRNCDSYLYGPDQLVYFQDIRDALKYQQKIEVVVMVIDQASVDSHFPPLLNYIEDMRQEEERIDLKIKQAQRQSGGSNRFNRAASSNSGHFGGDQALHGSSETDQMSVAQQVFAGGKNPLSPSSHYRMSRAGSCLPELMRKKEQAARMEVFDFKLQKYKRSSVFFWFKPLPLKEQGAGKTSLRGSQMDDMSMNQYPSDHNFKHTRQIETSGELTEHFKVSVKAIKNLASIIGNLKANGGVIKVQKIEYRDTTTKSRLSKEKQNPLTKSRDTSPEGIPTPRSGSTAKRNDSLGSEKQPGAAVSTQDFSGLRFMLKSEADDEDHHKKDPKSFAITPRYIQIQGVIMLGSKCLSTYSLTPLADINNIDKLDCRMTFFKDMSSVDKDGEKKTKKKKELLKISEIPSLARLCFNVILVEETNFRDLMRARRTGYILGSLSTSIFDFKHELKNGRKNLKIWPFEAFHPRLVCQNECNTVQRGKTEENAMVIDLLFDTKPNVCWGIKREHFNKADEAEAAEERESDDFKRFLEIESEHLNKVKQMIDRYPEEDKDPLIYEPALLFKYRDYVDVIPAFIKSVNFADPVQVAQCYHFLETNEKAKNLKPEEALALLDSQFGDEFIRIYALQRISKLDDYILALYMPQLVQALKYELFHESVLSAFLIERAIKNTSVIGHAFYWSIKASMHSKMSFERYYLILERFLMCCGSFKFRLYNETVVTRALMDVSQAIQGDFWLIEGVKRNKDFNEHAERIKMNALLQEKEREIKLRLHLICTRARFDVIDDGSDTSSPVGSQPNVIDGQITVHGGSGRLLTQSLASKKSHNPFYQHQSSTQSIAPGQAYMFNIQEVEKIIDQVIREKEKWHERSYIIKGQPDLREDEWLQEVFYFPIEPRKPITGFDQTSGFFVSKKIPLRIVARLSEDQIHQKRRGTNQSAAYRRMETTTIQQAQLKQPVATPNKVKVMFKYGDDLRQDNLVLQFFKLMDRLWMQNGLNLEMNAYNVIETGNKIGFIEFVDNAEEISSIHKKYGNFKGPFQETSILNYVEELWNNDEDREKMTVSRKEYHTNFIKSVAGQCAATYILGIGDRHTGNYMLQKYTGRFFHIDFGHFLGHWKKKFGIRRDVEPFIFSREMCHFITRFNPDATINIKSQQALPTLGGAGDLSNISVMMNGQDSFMHLDDDIGMKIQDQKGRKGSKNKVKEDYDAEPKSFLSKSFQCFSKGTKTSAQTPQLTDLEMDPEEKQKQENALKYFEEQGSQAYNILRKNAHTLINLLTLMIAGDIVQLNDTSMRFLIDRLKLSKTDEEASADFKSQIQVATKAWIRRVDSVFHNIMDELKKGNKKKQQTALTNPTQATQPNIQPHLDNSYTGNALSARGGESGGGSTTRRQFGKSPPPSALKK